MQSKRIGAERVSSEGMEGAVRAAPWWVYLCLVVAGVGCNWYFVFEWFSGRYSYWSGPVLYGMVLTVMGCAFIAILAVCAGRAKWRGAVQIFFLVSWGLYEWMFVGLVGRWPGQPK
jgi:hypothetical protein